MVRMNRDRKIPQVGGEQTILFHLLGVENCTYFKQPRLTRLSLKINASQSNQVIMIIQKCIIYFSINDITVYLYIERTTQPQKEW